jgi:hypothetical protein
MRRVARVARTNEHVPLLVLNWGGYIIKGMRWLWVLH